MCDILPVDMYGCDTFRCDILMDINAVCDISKA
jgi:hypothetical protein